MQNLTQKGFTLAFLDPFQPSVEPLVRDGIMDGICGRPSRLHHTRYKLATYLKTGFRL